MFFERDDERLCYGGHVSSTLIRPGASWGSGCSRACVKRKPFSIVQAAAAVLAVATSASRDAPATTFVVPSLPRRHPPPPGRRVCSRRVHAVSAQTHG